MGLFDIFKKKDCEICGKEVGLLGYKKLEDGEICKDCVKLLSPFFDERRHSTVEQIKAQIASREQNQRELETFNHNVSFGNYYKIFIETKAGVPSRFVVSRSDDYKSENADIISFKDVSACDIDIRDRRSEEKYTNDKGERVSYNPPRYTYSYDFYIKLTIANIPYINEIRFQLNNFSVNLETVQNSGGVFGGMFNKGFDPMLYPEYREYKSMCDSIGEYISCGQRGVAYGVQTSAIPNDTQDSEMFHRTEYIHSIIDRMGNALDMETFTALQKEFVALTMGHPCKSALREKASKVMIETETRLRCQEMETATSAMMANATTNFAPNANSAPAATSWICDCCGSENTGKFCSNCGKKFDS